MGAYFYCCYVIVYQWYNNTHKLGYICNWFKTQPIPIELAIRERFAPYQPLISMWRHTNNHYHQQILHSEIEFHMGLLQKFHRNTFTFVMNTSEISVDGVMVRCFQESREWLWQDLPKSNAEQSRGIVSLLFSP